MSALANILATTIVDTAGVRVLTNSATVDYNKTFAPAGQVSPGTFRYVDRSGGIPVGYPYMDFSVRGPVNGSRVYKILQRFRYPVLEVTAGSTGSGYQALPKVAYWLQETREVLIPEAALLADRTTFFSLIQSISADGIYANDLDPSHATGSPFRDAVILLDQPF